MAAQVLCRHQSVSVLGALENAANSEIIVTVQADGVICYDETTKERKHSYPLSTSSTLRFQTPCVLDARSNTLHVALSQTSLPSGSPSPSFLVSHTPGMVSATTPRFRTWADVTPRVQLESIPHSLHMLDLPTASSTLLTVAFLNGSLAAVLPGSLTLTPLISASSTSTLLTATSHQNTICTLHETEAQANGSSGTSPTGSSSASTVLRVHSTTTQGGLQLRHTVHIHAPSPECKLQGSLSMCEAYALLQWTGGWVSVVHGLQSASSTATLSVKHFQVQQPIASASSETESVASGTPGKAPNSVSKKRKDAASAAPAASLPAGSLPTFLCCAVDSTQLFVLDLSSPTSDSASAHYTLVDTQFGCPLASGELPSVSEALQAPHPTSKATAGATPSCSLILQQRGSTADRAQMLLSLRGVVLQLDVPVGRADLMSMIGRLSMTTLQSSATSKPAVAAKNQFLQVDLLPVLMACSAPSTTTTSDPESTSEAPQQQTQDGDILRAIQTGILSSSQPPLKAVDLLHQMSQTPLPPQPTQLLDKTLVLFTRHSNNPAAAASMSPALTTQLLSAFVRTAIEVNAWPQVASLIKLLRPDGSATGALRLRLPTCPGLLPALASAGQYELLQLAAAQLVEVSSVDLLTTIATLLSPAGATIVQLRRTNYQRLRGHASKVLDKAALPELAEHPELVIVNARAAAAAIDGFTASEVTLHCLVALHVDGIEAQAAARCCLSNAQVDAFLSYLSKWVDKYTNTMCDASPVFGTQQFLIPEALMFPRFTQVLDWIKAIVDGHLARLLMTRSPLPHIQKLQSTLSMQVKCTEQLSMLRGVMDHMLARAPLPRAHVAAAQQYTVEVLDLSIRAQ